MLGAVESKIRNGLDKKLVQKAWEWDYSAYEDDVNSSSSDEIESLNNSTEEDNTNESCDVWICPGCNKHLKAGSKWYHKNKACKYYTNAPPPNLFDHEDSNCACCIYNEDGTKEMYRNHKFKKIFN